MKGIYFHVHARNSQNSLHTRANQQTTIYLLRPAAPPSAAIVPQRNWHWRAKKAMCGKVKLESNDGDVILDWDPTKPFVQTSGPAVQKMCAEYRVFFIALLGKTLSLSLGAMTQVVRTKCAYRAAPVLRNVFVVQTIDLNWNAIPWEITLGKCYKQNIFMKSCGFISERSLQYPVPLQ